MMCGGQSDIEANAQLLAYTPYFEKIKKSAKKTTMRCPPPPPQILNAWTNLYETRYAYHATWARLNGVLHKSNPSVCLYAYPPIVARQRLDENVNATTNSHATTEELLDAWFSMPSVSDEGKYAISSSYNLFTTGLRRYCPGEQNRTVGGKETHGESDKHFSARGEGAV
jgi:hypothetical protein